MQRVLPQKEGENSIMYHGAISKLQEVAQKAKSLFGGKMRLPAWSAASDKRHVQRAALKRGLKLNINYIIGLFEFLLF